MSGTGVSPAYDLVISGGSLGGTALALAMAGYGARVLVLERETRFGERLRGECLVPWGVAEARSLGIDRPLHGSGSVRTVGLWESHVGTGDPIRRDMAETTLQRLPSLTFYHPDMQEALLVAAADAGAEVRRGVTVEGVQPGTRPTVIASRNGTKEEIPTRLSVGADGRSSRLRGKAGFRSRRDPLRLRISGVLLAGSKAPRDRIIIARKPGTGTTALVLPIDDERVRAYVICHRDGEPVPLRGGRDLDRFVRLSVGTGADPDWYANVTALSSLATYEGADHWVDHPYRAGVALIGDAAAACDPSWGQGMAQTLRDARVLRDCLLAETDWEKAGHAYAQEHDRYFDAVHRVEDWFTRLILEVGPEADARRARAFPLLAEDPRRMPDTFWSGPEMPADESTRQRFFGEI